MSILSSSSTSVDVAVLGGGFSGLSTALRLADGGRSALLVEQQANLGGLARSFQVGDFSVEAFYHHYFTTDQEVVSLARRLLLIRLFQQAPRCRVGRGPAAVCEESASVSGGVRDRGGLPEVPGCLSLARRVPLSSVWASAGLHSRAETTVAVRGVSTPGLVDVGNGAPQYEDPADGLVLGCVPDDN